MKPLISIVIVNFNAGTLLDSCLGTIEGQEFRGFEVIVVDNASRDRSFTAVEQYPWAKLIRNSVNKGFAAGQNHGMRLAQGR